MVRRVGPVRGRVSLGRPPGLHAGERTDAPVDLVVVQGKVAVAQPALPKEAFHGKEGLHCNRQSRRRPEGLELLEGLGFVVCIDRRLVGGYRSRFGVLGLAPHEKQGAAKQKNQLRPQFHSSPRSTS